MSHNLTTALVEDLRARIVSGHIAPGERLPSGSTLIAEHGVSRTVVREAVARLQAEGLVHPRRGSGSYALTPPASPPGTGRPARTLQDRRALLGFRTGVESEATALAALAATARADHHLVRMEDALPGVPERS
ncbi:FadR/GntR family transcriptional regulator [Kocuria sp. M1R5S2]|uniref:FadR/GntR family transcriptional regulator n=1 Tax=Kocuria rhizosphaerae TaxID=3376285 RepID=UPI0037B44DB0